jgi:hypothetical protein
VFETEFNAVDGFENLKFAGRTDTGLVREFFTVHQIPVTESNFRKFFECYVFWLDHILAQSETGTCPGVVNFIDQLKGLPQPPLFGLLTGNIRLGAEIKLRHFGLWEEFRTGGFADDSEDRNEIAAIARKRGCQLLQEELRPDQVLVVGDTPWTSAAAAQFRRESWRSPPAAAHSKNCRNINPIGSCRLSKPFRRRKQFRSLASNCRGSRACLSLMPVGSAPAAPATSTTAPVRRTHRRFTPLSTAAAH